MFPLRRCVNKSSFDVLFLCLSRRFLSISKSDLIESSRTIQSLLGSSNDDAHPPSASLRHSLDQIHHEHSSSHVAVSTKQIYQTNASKFNSFFVKLEQDRMEHRGMFTEENPNEQLLVLLRYVRYLQVAFIYRLITFDINATLKQSFNSIVTLVQKTDDASMPLMCELSFFVYSLSARQSLSQVKSILSRTRLVNRLSIYLFSLLSKQSPVPLVNHLCSTLYSIVEMPPSSLIDTWPMALLGYLHSQQSTSLAILRYLILIQHRCLQPVSSSVLALLNTYLMETGIQEENLDILCELLVLIGACSYSHEVFQRKIIAKLEQTLKTKESRLMSLKLLARLIYYLCITDPTNRFQTRSIILELSRQMFENMSQENRFPQWIVQAQHGMMLVNIYNYQLLSATLGHERLPNLFQDLGISTWSVQRQLFEIHHALAIDRPQFPSPLLNSKMFDYAAKISDDYRASIRPRQKSYNRFLMDLKTSFNQIYGEQTCTIINTDKHSPHILFDFLEVNLSDRDELRTIGINPIQRIAVLPIFNSMLVRQQRADGSMHRVLNAHTSMRHRLIERSNYKALLIFHGDYLRAVRDNTVQGLIETSLALKTTPDQMDNLPI